MSTQTASSFDTADWRSGLQDHVLAFALTILIYGQAFAVGANSNTLAAAASLANIVFLALAASMVGAEAGERFARGLIGPGVVFGAALAWACIPLVRALLGFPGFIPPPLSPDAVWLELTKLIGVGAAFVAAALVAHDPARRRLATNWLVGGGLVYLLAALGIWSLNPDRVLGMSTGLHNNRFTATLVNGNVAGCFIGALVLVAAGRIASGTVRLRLLLRNPLRAWRTGVAMLLVGLGLLLILRTASRTGLVGVGLGLLALIAFLPARPGRSRRLGPLIALGGLVLAIVVAVGLGVGATFDRPVIAADVHSRLSIFELHLPLAAKSLWFGYGLGSFRSLHEHALTADNAVELWNANAMHQAFLQAVVEGGLPFALLICACLVIICRSVVAALIAGKAGKRWALSIVLAAAVIVIDSLDDIALNVPAVATLFTLLLGLAWGWAAGVSDDGTSETRQIDDDQDAYLTAA